VQSTLKKRFKGEPQAVAEGLAVFDSAAVAAIMPEPGLRAALALLLGTAGEGAIDAIVAGVFLSAEFAELPPVNGGQGIARSVTDPGTGKQKLLYNSTTT
jgi:hypothetical protein